MRGRQPFVLWAFFSNAIHLTAPLAILAFVGGCGDRTSQAIVEAQRAQSLLQAGKLPEARQAIQAAMRLRDDSLDIVLLDARIKLMMGDGKAAYDGYKLALALDPRSLEALQGVSMLGVNAGDDRQSIEAADRILLSDPGSADAKLIKGIAYINLRQFDAALALGNSILERDPRNEGGLVLKARSLFLLGQRDQALASLREAKQWHPRSPLVLRALLECAREVGDAPTMLEQQAALRALQPDNVDVAIDEANVRYKLRQTAVARTLGRAVISRHGIDDAAMSRLVGLWRDYDPTPLSSAALAALGETGPLRAQLALARHALDEGNLADAVLPVAKLPDAEGRALLIRIRQASGDKAADTSAETILAADKTNCDALAVRAERYIRSGQARSAIVPSQQIAAECPDRNDGTFLQVRAYTLLKLDTQVRRAFEEGISARPLDRELVERYAAWLASSGRKDAALAIARSFTVRAPSKPGGWQLLGKMCGLTGDADCRARAAAGEAASWRSFAIDLPPGQRRPNPLLGGSL